MQPPLRRYGHKMKASRDQKAFETPLKDFLGRQEACTVSFDTPPVLHIRSVPSTPFTNSLRNSPPYPIDR